MAAGSKLHVAVGFYLNGSVAINYVRDEDLLDNITYNKAARPGRIYFVDKEYVCGGLLQQPMMNQFIEQCRQKLLSMDIPEPHRDSRPYI